MNNRRAEQALRNMVAAEAQRTGLALEEFSCPEALVVMHGEMWTWKPLTRRFSAAAKWGAPRACFANTLIACATNADLRYVEGFAYCGQFAVHHAWAVNDHDEVLDFTWREDVFLPRHGRAYYGVPCPIRQAFDATWNDMGCLQTDGALGAYTWHDDLPTDADRRYVMGHAVSLLKGPRQRV